MEAINDRDEVAFQEEAKVVSQKQIILSLEVVSSEAKGEVISYEQDEEEVQGQDEVPKVHKRVERRCSRTNTTRRISRGSIGS